MNTCKMRSELRYKVIATNKKGHIVEIGRTALADGGNVIKLVQNNPDYHSIQIIDLATKEHLSNGFIEKS